MTPDQKPVDDFEPAYRSGIAARLAGIPVETLRVWERRYHVVAPRLDARGHRLYCAEDVSRLTLIRQLVALGSAIGSIANLSLAALRAMRSAAAAASEGRSIDKGGLSRGVRVALVGEALEQQVASPDGSLLPAFEIVAACVDQAAATKALRGIAADLLAIALPTLQADCVESVDMLVRLVDARHAVVEYRFGPATLVHALRERGHTVARAPIDADELERICRNAMSRGDTPLPSQSAALAAFDVVPSRRFDDQSLARIARTLTTLYCECPHHVVELLLSLGTFEHYSAECANRDPADAELHRYLQRVAGSARALFEDALVRIARAEKVALPVAPPAGNVTEGH